MRKLSNVHINHHVVSCKEILEIRNLSPFYTTTIDIKNDLLTCDYTHITNNVIQYTVNMVTDEILIKVNNQTIVNSEYMSYEVLENTLYNQSNNMINSLLQKSEIPLKNYELIKSMIIENSRTIDILTTEIIKLMQCDLF